jgi:glutathione reductase (NADPH)
VLVGCSVMVATGGWPIMPDFPGSEHCISSNEMFHLKEQPKRLVVQGAGYIAMEFAGVFNALGSHVTVVNRSEVILRGYDEQIVERLLHIAMMRGIDFHMHCKISKVEKQEDGSLLVHTGKGDPVHADQVLIATGRKPNSADRQDGRRSGPTSPGTG